MSTTDLAIGGWIFLGATFFLILPAMGMILPNRNATSEIEHAKILRDIKERAQHTHYIDFYSDGRIEVVAVEDDREK